MIVTLYDYQAIFDEPDKISGTYLNGQIVGRCFYEYDLFFVGCPDVCGLVSTLQAALAQYVHLRELLLPLRK